MPVDEGVVGDLKHLFSQSLVREDHAELADHHHVGTLQLHLQRHVELDLVAAAGEVDGGAGRRRRRGQRARAEDAREGGGAAQVAKVPALAVGDAHEDLVLRVPQHLPRVGQHHAEALDAHVADGLGLHEPLLRADGEGAPQRHGIRALVMHKGHLRVLVVLVPVAFRRGLQQLRAPQVPSGLAPPVAAPIEDRSQAGQLGQVWDAAVGVQPAHVRDPVDEGAPRLVVGPEARKQTHNFLLALVRFGIPALDEVQDLRLRADGHAVVAQRALDEVHGQRAPARVARHRLELCAGREHLARDDLDQRMPRVLLRDRHLVVLQVVEGVREVPLTHHVMAVVAEPLKEVLEQRINRVLLGVNDDMQHLVHQGLPFVVGLRPHVEEGHVALVHEAEQLGHPLAVAVHRVALRQEVRVSSLHSAGRASDEVCRRVARLRGVLPLHL
mmetsp:Transcript_69289/g.178550  ORF Transcript_69289/g.178550 Transcript_69289/m.178550 type:complete len:441 (-) Transcript_69289:370-1692(-)